MPSGDSNVGISNFGTLNVRNSNVRALNLRTSNVEEVGNVRVLNRKIFFGFLRTAIPGTRTRLTSIESRVFREILKERSSPEEPNANQMRIALPKAPRGSVALSSESANYH